MSIKQKIFLERNYMLLLSLLSLTLIFFNVVSSTLNSSANQIYLPWPGKQVISSILYSRDELSIDFLSLSAANSPYDISAKLLSTILPSNWDSLLASYSVLSLLLQTIVLWLSVILLIKSWRLIAQNNNLIAPSHFLLFSSIAYIALSIVLPRLYNRGTDNIRGVFHGVQMAGWDFPLHDSLNPSGISFAFVLIALIITCKSDYERSYISLKLSGIIIFISTLIHPVVPLFALAYTSSMAILSKNKLTLDHSELKKTLIFTFSWTCGALIIFYSYPQAEISPLEYFKIYVTERHPHHYLPSAYIKTDQIGLLKNIVTTLTLALITYKIKKSTWPIKAFITCYFLLFIVHATQYIFVEKLNSISFISLGPSRLSGIYNFLFLLLNFIFISSIASTLISKYHFERAFKTIKYTSIQPYTRLALILISFLTMTLLLTYIPSFYENQLRLIPLQSERAIRLGFDAHVKKDNYEVISEFEYKNLREIGGVPVFSDSYFPFTIAAIPEWKARKTLVEEFLTCVNTINSLKPCSSPLGKDNKIYFLSHTQKLNEEISFEIDTLQGKVYVYKL